MTPLRLAVVSDLREEQWHSMDLVSELLVAGLGTMQGSERYVEPVEVCSAMVRRLTRIPIVGRMPMVGTADRVINRYWDYPRWLRRQARDFDLFHVVDHSYAHLASHLPEGRTIVTCHDLDAFAGVLPGRTQTSWIAQAMGRRLLDGLRAAAHVVCGSESTRQGLVAHGLVTAARVTVVPYAVHPVFSPAADPWADQEAGRLCGATSLGEPALLHVGSTISRKRIDVLLEVFADIRRRHPGARLWRVGGPLTVEQTEHARRVGVLDHLVTLPFVDRRVLSAVYRRAALVVQPSEREGFGLPVIEAMACGTPVVASDIAALREAGGTAATYCCVADVDAWAAALDVLLDERATDAAGWGRRCDAATRHTRRFAPALHAHGMTAVYRQVLPGAFEASVALAECG